MPFIPDNPKGNFVPDNSPPNPAFLPNSNAVEQTIQNRPSMVKDLISDPSTLDRFKQHPLGTILRTLGGAMEYAEGIPAVIGMAAQKGSFKDVPVNIQSLLTGNRPAQLGDLIRTTGFGGSLNEPIAASTGVLAMMANPPGAKIANTIQSKTFNPVLNSVNKIMNPAPEELLNRAQKLTTEILQPSKNELTDYLVQGKQLPAVEQATKVIKESKNYQELNQNLDSSITDIFTKRNDILKNNNFDIQPTYMDNLDKLIKDTQASGQATDSEIQQMNDVLSREKSWYTSNGNKLSRLEGQSRKELLQNQTESLLQKLQTGDTIDTQPARRLALNAVRAGLKTAVEGGDFQVASLNSTYNGLKRAKELVAGQIALDQKAIQETGLQRAMHMLTKPQDIPGLLAKNAAAQRATGLLNNTRKIEKLVNKARKGGLNP